MSKVLSMELASYREKGIRGGTVGDTPSGLPLNREERRLTRKMLKKDPDLANYYVEMPGGVEVTVGELVAPKGSSRLPTNTDSKNKKPKKPREYFELCYDDTYYLPSYRKDNRHFVLLEPEMTATGLSLKVSDDDVSFVSDDLVSVNMTWFLACVIVAYKDRIDSKSAIEDFLAPYRISNSKDLPETSIMMADNQIYALKLFTLLRSLETTGVKEDFLRLLSLLDKDLTREVKLNRKKPVVSYFRKAKCIIGLFDMVKVTTLIYYHALTNRTPAIVSVLFAQEIGHSYSGDSMRKDVKFVKLEDETREKVSQLKSFITQNVEAVGGEENGYTFADFNSLALDFDIMSIYRKIKLEVAKESSFLKSGATSIGGYPPSAYTDNYESKITSLYTSLRSDTRNYLAGDGFYSYFTLKKVMKGFNIPDLGDTGLHCILERDLEQLVGLLEAHYKAYGGRRLTDQEVSMLYFSVMQIMRVTYSYSSMIERYLSEQDLFDISRSEHEALKEEMEEKNKQLSEKDDEIAKLKRELASLTAENNMLSSINTSLREESRTVSRTISQLEKDNAKLEQDNGTLVQQVKDLESELIEVISGEDNEHCNKDVSMEDMVSYLSQLDIGIFGGTAEWANQVREVFPHFRWKEHTNNSQPSLEGVTNRDFLFINPRNISHAISEKAYRHAVGYARVLRWRGGMIELIREMYTFAKSKSEFSSD